MQVKGFDRLWAWDQGWDQSFVLAQMQGLIFATHLVPTERGFSNWIQQGQWTKGKMWIASEVRLETAHIRSWSSREWNHTDFGHVVHERNTHPLGKLARKQASVHLSGRVCRCVNLCCGIVVQAHEVSWAGWLVYTCRPVTRVAWWLSASGWKTAPFSEYKAAVVLLGRKRKSAPSRAEDFGRPTQVRKAPWNWGLGINCSTRYPGDRCNLFHCEACASIVFWSSWSGIIKHHKL